MNLMPQIQIYTQEQQIRLFRMVTQRENLCLHNSSFSVRINLSQKQIFVVNLQKKALIL